MTPEWDRLRKMIKALQETTKVFNDRTKALRQQTLNAPGLDFRCQLCGKLFTDKQELSADHTAATLVGHGELAVKTNSCPQFGVCRTVVIPTVKENQS